MGLRRWLADKGNTCESLINVVTIEMPKLLLGIAQNGMWLDLVFLPRETSSMCHRRRGGP